MCDYSLAGLPSRLAVEGEQPVVRRFPTGTRGLASPNPSGSRWWSAKQTPAVCIPPGARLLLRDIPENLQQQLGVVGTEEVTFAQLSATPYQYRDAVRFNNGQETHPLRAAPLSLLPRRFSSPIIPSAERNSRSRNVAAQSRRWQPFRPASWHSRRNAGNNCRFPLPTTDNVAPRTRARTPST